MNMILNDLLYTLPLDELTFINPFPRENITYNKIVTSIDELQFSDDTLLLIKDGSDLLQINKKEVAHKLVQNIHLSAIVICSELQNVLQAEIIDLFTQCKIPLIKINNKSLLENFQNKKGNSFSYHNLSVELDRFNERGFINIANNLATGFSTPILFLDEDDQLLWKTGPEEELRQWLRSLQLKDEESSEALFQRYTINVASKVQLSLIVSSSLVSWQQKIIDKFIGFTAVLLKTDEVIREQNDKFKQFFIYELIYRKFESKTVLINQGKTWGWNFEKPHHLFVIDIETADQLKCDNYELEEIAFHLEIEKVNLLKNIIVFPLQDHLILMIEDSNNGDISVSDRKEIPLQVAEWARNEILSKAPDYSVRIGIGKWYKDTINLNKSYQEAKVAIQFGKLWFDNRDIYHMHDLGSLHLLANIHDDMLIDYCKQYLSPLINSDKNQGTEYLLTLKMYFQYDGVINDVSENMYIHPNTLRKRLRRIEELLGINIQKLNDLLTLMLAIKIYYSFNISI